LRFALLTGTAASAQKGDCDNNEHYDDWIESGESQSGHSFIRIDNTQPGRFSPQGWVLSTLQH